MCLFVYVPEYTTCTIDFQLAAAQQHLKTDLKLSGLHIKKFLGLLMRAFFYPDIERGEGCEDSFKALWIVNSFLHISFLIRRRRGEERLFFSD